MDAKMLWVFPVLILCHFIWLLVSILVLDSLLLLLLGHSLISAIAFSMNGGYDEESNDSNPRSSG